MGRMDGEGLVHDEKKKEKKKRINSPLPIKRREKKKANRKRESFEKYRIESDLHGGKQREAVQLSKVSDESCIVARKWNL